MKILVADDDASSRLIARMVLERLGHECDIAIDGTQAWNAFQTGHYDVVVSDWLMPGQTGPQLCQNIRAQRHGTQTYVILLTSRGAQAQILEGMNAGADDYLIKPLNPEELEVRLIAADRVTSLHRQLADQRTQLQSLNLEHQARAGDALYRYGGEEFLCILPEQALAGAVRATQRMRASVQHLNLPHVGSDAGVITLSAGVAPQPRFRRWS